MTLLKDAFRRRLHLIAGLILILFLFPLGVVKADAPHPSNGEPSSTQVGSADRQASGEPSAGCTPQVVSVQNAAYEQQIVELVNQKRADYGLPPLKRNPNLDQSARAHSKDVHDDRYFYHDTYDRINGGLVRVCGWNERISLVYPGTPEGENVAGGFDTAEKAMRAWMGSAGHRANILNKTFREIGVGYFAGPNAHNTYWTQDFGTRGGVYPLVINREAASTSLPQVSLYIYREDSSWNEMRLRNDEGAWSEWQPFAAEVTWTLEWVEGVRTVTVQLRNGSSVRQESDTIELTTSDPTRGALPGARFGLTRWSPSAEPAQAAAPLDTSGGVVASAGWVPVTGQETTPESDAPTPEGVSQPPDGQGEIGVPAFSEQGDPGETGVVPFFTGCARFDVAVQNAAYEQEVIRLVNLERANAGMPPLKRNTDLDYAARYHSKDLHDDNYFEHDSYDRSGGDLVFACGWSTRVANFYSGGTKGENIAAGYSTPAAAMAGWMNSQGHRENILRSSYREIGVGYFYGSNGYRSYWTQDFGSRSGVYPVVINREDASTDVPQVNLYVYREDSTWTEMRLRNDAGTWTAWQPYASNVNWTLDWAQGTRTVTVETRKGGTVRSASDTIQQTTSGNRLGNLPDQVFFIYDKSAAQLHPPSVTLQPLNTGSSAVLTWTASESVNWLSVNPAGGTTPSGTFTITPGGSELNVVGTKTTNVTVTVTNPASPPTEGSPKAIQVVLNVVNALDKRIFLPAILK